MSNSNPSAGSQVTSLSFWIKGGVVALALYGLVNLCRVASEKNDEPDVANKRNYSSLVVKRNDYAQMYNSREIQGSFILGALALIVGGVAVLGIHDLYKSNKTVSIKDEEHKITSKNCYTTIMMAGKIPVPMLCMNVTLENGTRMAVFCKTIYDSINEGDTYKMRIREDGYGGLHLESLSKKSFVAAENSRQDSSSQISR